MWGMTMLLAVGTRKGLFLARSADGGEWTVEGPQFLMREIPAVGFVAHGAGPRMLVGVRSEHWGPTVSHSDDLGATWAESEGGAVRFPEGTEAALERIWQLQGDPVRPGRVWAGCEPTSLWRSDDAGETFGLVEGLWNHPHRPDWHPGAGGAAVHSVITDPSDDARLLVAMSTGGVYVTSDGGTTWSPSNTGISAYFNPDPYPEYGQCVHKIAADASGPGVLYAQNHHGVYRSDDAGATWGSIADGLPSDFGFVMLAHPHAAGTVWVLPLEADARRVPPGGRLRVHRTADGGRSWTEVGAGLPDGSWTSVLRDAACVLDRGPQAAPLVAFGTRDGCVFVSTDEGDSFAEVAAHLPDVLSVRAAVIP
jgi:photosystem II stability/assembly factor-like uncharacterized protein